MKRDIKIVSLIALSLLIGFGLGMIVAKNLGQSLNNSQEGFTQQGDKSDEDIKYDFSMKMKCKEEGEKLHQQLEKDFADSNVTLYEPEYHYNKELNTCLYWSGYIKFVNGEKMQERWVKDSLENKEIIMYGDYPTEKSLATELDYYLPKEEFKQSKKELFNN